MFVVFDQEENIISASNGDSLFPSVERAKVAVQEYLLSLYGYETDCEEELELSIYEINLTKTFRASFTLELTFEEV